MTEMRLIDTAFIFVCEGFVIQLCIGTQSITNTSRVGSGYNVKYIFDFFLC